MEKASRKGQSKPKKISLTVTKAANNTKKMKKIRKIKKQNKKKACESDDSEEEENFKVDFNTLSIHTLRKYKKAFNLPIASNLHKSELAKAVNKHFPTIPLESEKEIITYFICFAKNDQIQEEE